MEANNIWELDYSIFMVTYYTNFKSNPNSDIEQTSTKALTWKFLTGFQSSIYSRTMNVCIFNNSMLVIENNILF